MPWIFSGKTENKSGKKVTKPKKRTSVIAEGHSGRPLPESIFKQYRPFYQDNNSLLLNSLKGVKMSSVIDFLYISKRDRGEVVNLIHTSLRSLQYLTSAKKLPPLQSELLLKLFALYDKGLGVFDGVESFNGWLKAPSFGLYNEVPERLLTTFTGIGEVMDELIRIEYGDLA